MIQSFRDLEVYKESYQLSLEIDQLVKKFPPQEKFNLVDQMRRASRSIPANIAEGFAKRCYVQEFKKHLIVSIGSSNEMEVHLETAKDLHLTDTKSYEEFIERYQIVGKKLNKLIQSWKKF